MGEWANLAEQLAGDVREPGFGAAAVNAAAYRARVDQDATRGLVGAAMALTEGEALSALWAPTDPCPDNVTLVSWTENLEAHVAALLKRCEDLGRAARAERDSAVRARNMALSAASSATAEDAQANARARAENAERAIADCAAALEVLGEADCKLRYARDLLRAVPGELSEVYEAPAALVNRGGKMPHSGDFIVPGGTTETIAAR
jgi:hypothetical protein